MFFCPAQNPLRLPVAASLRLDGCSQRRISVHPQVNAAIHRAPFAAVGLAVLLDELRQPIDAAHVAGDFVIQDAQFLAAGLCLGESALLQAFAESSHHAPVHGAHHRADELLHAQDANPQAQRGGP